MIILTTYINFELMTKRILVTEPQFLLAVICASHLLTMGTK
jgi:hypothetical protein